jgi:hypothetical protein
MFDGFWNAFWLFIGVVAGALIQYALEQIKVFQQRRNAKRLFGIETSINRQELNRLRETFLRNV